MAELRAISTSDWHLDGLKRLFPNDHIERQLNEIDKIYQYAHKNGINYIFVPGDISDSHNMPWATYYALYNHFKKWDAFIQTFYISGNHDFEEINKTSIDFLKMLAEDGSFKNLHIITKPEQRTIEGVVVNFLPFPAERSIPHKKPCLNFAHVSYDGAVGDNGRIIKMKDEIETDCRDHTISGHIHEYQHMEKKRVTFNGNPFQKNFGERSAKGFIVFTAKYKKGKLKFRHEFINNHPEFTLESVIINKLSDFADLRTDDNVRYRLYVDPTVTVPTDLRIKNPNVVQILDSQGKKKIKELDCAEEFKQQAMDIPEIDPMLGLTSRLKENGFSKSQRKQAAAFIAKAVSTFNA
tara:strand:- start:825 stop:1880 length:1056 start_codon:yes stop_codon:yes gene_type:complete